MDLLYFICNWLILFGVVLFKSQNSHPCPTCILIKKINHTAEIKKMTFSHIKEIETTDKITLN